MKKDKVWTVGRENEQEKGRKRMRLGGSARVGIGKVSDFRIQKPQNSKSSSAGNSFDNDKNYVGREIREGEYK